MSQKQPKASKNVWVTREGQRVRVQDLSDSHLSNTIQFLRRRVTTFRINYALRADQAIASLNGEQARYSIEDGAAYTLSLQDDDFLAEVIPTWASLLKEADRRKL